MTILFAGGELTSFVPTDTTNVTESTTAAQRDTVYSRSAVSVNGITAYAEGTYISSATTAWFHAELYIGANSNNGPLLVFYNSAGTAVFRLNVPNFNVMQMQYWNGSAWTDIGASYTFPTSTRFAIDIKIVCGSSGSASLYVTGTQVSTATATMTSVTNIAKVRLYSNSSFTAVSYSQCVAADESTVGWKLATLAPSANGANTAWTNDFAAVDEPATMDDTDFITSSVAGDVETFVATDAPTGTGLGVKALVVTARAKIGATGPQNLQMAVRSGGANYFTGNVPGLAAGFNGVLGVFNTDPATSATWTPANLNSAEIGVKSIA